MKTTIRIRVIYWRTIISTYVIIVYVSVMQVKYLQNELQYSVNAGITSFRGAKVWMFSKRGASLPK